MATELNLATLRPLFIAVALFALIAGASFGWATIEGQSANGAPSEARLVALPN